MDNVLALESTKDDTYGAQKAATDTVTAEREAVRQQFSEHRQLAKLAFKGDRNTETQLKLDIRLKKDFKNWLTQATTFYDKISQHQEGMARYGVTAEVLQLTQTRLQALVALYDQQTQRKAEAQNNTEQRNKAIKELDAEMREFYQIAKFALKDEPQLMEAIGMSVPAQV